MIERDAKKRVYTLGHSQRSESELVAILRAWSVRVLVDIRTIPRSRTNPQFDRDVLPAALGTHGIGYTHLAALGGLRGRAKTRTNTNDGWHLPSFRNYADYAQTPAFAAGFEELVGIATETRATIMCAEALWWRCHRRIVTDYLLVRGFEVTHLFSPTESEPAVLTPFAHPQPDGTVSYPADAVGAA